MAVNITDAINYILSPGLQEKLLSLKVIFIILSAIFLIGIILLSLKTTYLRMRYWQNRKDLSRLKPSGERKLVKNWKRIKKRLEKDDEGAAKMAILEADKMVGDVLKRMGYLGENLDERLEKIDRNIIPSLDLLKEIHIISNKIDQDFEYYVSLKDAKKIIDNYEKIFEELQMF